MNKALLVWNLVITMALAAVVFTGCTSMDPQFTSLQTEVRNNRAVIEQVISLSQSNREAINTNNTAIATNTLVINNLQSSTQAAIAASDASLRQYVEQVVNAYLAAQQ
jgi:predicted component of type VI protein secretion system